MNDKVRPEFSAAGWTPLSDPMSVKPGQMVRWFGRYREGEGGEWLASGGIVDRLDREDGPVARGYINFGSLKDGEWEVYDPYNPAANGAETPPRAEFSREGWVTLEDIMEAQPGDMLRNFYSDPVREIWYAECGVVSAVDPILGLFAGGDYLIGHLDDCSDWEVRRTT